MVNFSRSPDAVHIHRNILTKSWEEWLVEKAILDLKKVQMKKEIKCKRKMEEKQKAEEQRKRRQQELENRKRWLTEKNYELEKKRKEEAAQKEYEKLKEKQKMELIESKSKAAYEKWMAVKMEAVKKKKSKENEQKTEFEKKEIERRRCNQEAYNEWLEKSKKRKENTESKGSLKKKHGTNIENYFEIMTVAKPSYVNPVEWQGVLDESKSRNTSRGRQISCPFQSPPLLWRDYETRSSGSNANGELAQSKYSIVRRKRC